MKCSEYFTSIKYPFIEVDGQECLMVSKTKNETYDYYDIIDFPCNSIEDFICGLAELKWFKACEVFDSIYKSEAFRTEKRNKKELTIALYYRNIKNGGAQRVTALLANMFSNQIFDNDCKYKVILITDEEIQEQGRTFTPIDENDNFDYSIFSDINITEYKIDKIIVRETIPGFEVAVKGVYRERYEAWEKIINKYDVDIVISGLWSDSCTFWDMLTVKAQPSHPAFIMINHNFSIVPYLYQGDTALRLTKMYSMSDATIVLSKTDEEYVRNFTSRVFHIPNPIDFKIDNPISEYEEGNILWVGRFSGEKKPQDALAILNIVLNKHPKAKLYMVGTGSESIIKDVIKKITDLGMENNVKMIGFTDEPGQYYKKASMLLSTSKFEGFPTTYIEAFAHGLPVVTYDMPWLSLFEDDRGLLKAPQGDYETMADHIQYLLENPYQNKVIGQKAKEKINEYISNDVMKDWKNVFEIISEGQKDIKESDFNYIKCSVIYQNQAKQTLISRSNTIQKTLNKKISDISSRLKMTFREKSEINAKLQQTYKEKSEINAKLQQTYKEKAEIRAELQQIKNLL